MVGNFVTLSDLLPASVASAKPEPQLLFDGHLVLTTTSKKPKRHVKHITTWMAFSIYCLILTSFFPHRSKGLHVLQYKLLILKTHCQFSGKVWLTYNRAFREHAAATKVVDLSSVNVLLFNFHAAGASARGPNAVSPRIVRTGWGKFVSKPVQVLEHWSSCGLKRVMSFSVFQLLWCTSCCQLPRASLNPTPDAEPSSMYSQILCYTSVPVYFLLLSVGQDPFLWVSLPS